MDGDEQLHPRFRPLPEDSGFAIVDPIERRRYAVHTSTAVRPSPVDGSPFEVPVDVTAEFSTERIVLPEVVDVSVHDADGDDVVRVQPIAEQEFPAGRYHVELSAPIKVYFDVRAPLAVTVDVDAITFDLGGHRDVRIGARSYHERPATTLETTADPRDAMTALSYLGSALKTTSPERSYPTLRGHPPAIELGDDLRVPSTLERPDTGVTLELPADLGTVFAAAPLAYYLGADVEPADEPRIVTDAGFERSLGDPDDDFEGEVERVLKQVFLLDCVTRTEGYYRLGLHEREAIEPHVDLEFERLYDRPLAEQLEAYLDVPYETLADQVPRWPLTAHVPPRAELVEAIPYAVNELAVIRSPTARELSPTEVRTRALERYMTNGGPHRTARGSTGERSADEPDGHLRVVRLPETDSLDDAWFGEGVPLHATKADPRAYRNRFERRPREGPIEITVVCNDVGTTVEDDVATDVYGSRSDLPFDVTLLRNLTTDELGEVFASGVDFLHYIGHVDRSGFQCRDGALDAGTFDGADVDAFFLNACRSYRQGVRLIEAGATGGVATISDVVNSSAATVGRAVARLLDLGFPLRAALTLARDESVAGSHYVVLGDGGADLASARNVVPVVCDVTEVAEGEYELAIRVYVPKQGGVGGTFFPTIEANDAHYLIPGELEAFRLPESELREYLAWHPYPVRTENGLAWNDTTDDVDL